MRFYIPNVICCILFTVFATTVLFAQSRVYGTVKDVNHKAIIGANVLLLRSSDSILVKGIITDAAGNFNFEKIDAGRYIVSSSFADFKPYYSQVINVANEDLNTGVINLNNNDKELSVVTLVSRKPLFEQKIDRMVINVKNSITSAGGTALEVLEKSPGVIVNKQSNSIGLNGKEGVVIMINGKISRIPADAVLQMLSGMNASNIDRIELITTPPANFDAEGNAGFINIVLVNNPNKGFNGSYSLTMGYGKGYTPAGAVNFNYRNKKVNLFGDYSFTWNNQEQQAINYRRTLTNGVTTENYTDAHRHPEDGAQHARLGMDVQVTPKTVIGVLIGGYDTKWKMKSYNSLSVVKNNVQDTMVSVVNKELNHWKHIMGNINLAHTIAEGETITADLDYLYYKDNNPNEYVNSYFNGNGMPLGAEQTRSGKLTPLKIWVAKTDYTRKLGKKVNAEAGLKIAVSRFTNDVSVETWNQNNWVKNPEYTARYNLKENIAAAYSAFTITASEKTSLKLGLRYEYTTSNLGSETQKNIVDRKYGRWFPSLFMSQKINDNNSFNVSYSRRITRPTFKDMAPFVIFIDPYTFFSGNSGLQPAFSDIFKTDYLLNKFVLSASYTFEDQSIANFQPKVDKNNKQLFVSENLDNIKTVNLSLSLPFTITKWWNMQNNLQGTWQQVNAFFKNGPFSVEQKNFSGYSSNSFTLPKNYSIELSGFYQSKRLFGASIFQGVSILNVGLQKMFGEKNDKLRFAVSDIFANGFFRSVSDIPEENIYVKFKIRFNQRTYKLTYTHNFGNNKLNSKRNHSTASEEEQRRMN
ncbi:MAG TPA: outer membrane beta-barrel family protein [Chitinophagaceae bacterium]